ncbi:hypothetical protein J8L73_12250 [Pseudoalteromonas sp. MMG006]|uniref:hypothetical protein n=1 Tax=Pseudoalteromonas sp. MMG006 TaxID=2822683 RepID=UPI001B361912|nr:hypothetical protein [Pseudoalteromonas sp. MMG006]MBQ4799893.1 hypothetical protein [Pseudoalteromonas sp. MMG006]
MVGEWISLILSGAFSGFFIGAAIFVVIYFGMLYLFDKTNDDVAMLIASVVIVLILFGFYGVSIKNFLEAAQSGNNRPIEDIFRAVPFIMAHALFLACAYVGVRLSKMMLRKKLLGY